MTRKILNVIVLICMLTVQTPVTLARDGRQVNNAQRSTLHIDPAAVEVAAAVPDDRRTAADLTASTWITLTETGFAPQVLTVSVGTEVTWYNTTDRLHILRGGEPVLHTIYLPLILRQSQSATIMLPQRTVDISYDANMIAHVRLGETLLISGTLPPGGTYTQTFTSAGDYPYYLATAPQLRGRVVVTAEITAPPLDLTVPTTMISSTAFLYTGDNPIQTDVAPGTIDPVRVAVLRGRVLDREDNPLPDVTITILNHPEFGQTRSRADGMFDMAVNGGGLLTIQYEKDGYLPAQRQVDVPWQDFDWAPDVVLIPLDPQVTAVDLTQTDEDFVVAQGSVVSDTDGTRQATLLVPQGTQAELVLPGGVTQSVSSLNIRITEYTVGDNGPEAMPAELPTFSGYTYAAEFSADEALAAGATDVNFDQPLYTYLEDFIGFPVGSAVPTGYYDKELGRWVASENGRVVEVLTITDGLADLDTDGDGVADNGVVITPTMVLTITEAERAEVARLYPQAPQQLWRVPIKHFTPYDCNWPYGCTDEDEDGRADCEYPNIPEPGKDELDDNVCKTNGSIVECQNQNLGEHIPIVGTPFSLNYRSGRVLGRKTHRIINIPITSDEIPLGLRQIRLSINVAGNSYSQVIPTWTLNQRYRFVWDGRDAYGRIVQGSQPVHICLGYEYPLIYRGLSVSSTPGGSTGGGFGSPGSSIAASMARRNIVLRKCWSWFIGGANVGEIQRLGGWTLSPQHNYDFYYHMINLGDGSQRSVKSIKPVIQTVAGGRLSGGWGEDGILATESNLIYPNKIVVGPDGSFYFDDGPIIRRVDASGIITTVAGGGDPPDGLGDGGLATEAKLSAAEDIALAPDGSLYIADHNPSFWHSAYVRRVDPSGIITTVAGGGDIAAFPCKYGVPATELDLGHIMVVAVSPDGNLYFGTGPCLYQMGTDGIAWSIAGGGSATGSYGDGGLATQAYLGSQILGMDIGPDGSIYLADAMMDTIRRIGPDGIITRVVGIPFSAGFNGDGGLATQVQLNNPSDIAVAPDGSLYIADRSNNRVRYVSPEGIVSTIAGYGAYSFLGDGGPATAATLNNPYGVAVAPDGSYYIVDHQNERIRQVTSPLPGFNGTEFAIPSGDGSELYRFNANGKHLSTLNAQTGAVIYQFGYDEAGLLVSVTDADGNITTIERDAEGDPTAIVGPYGQRTILSLDANGYLAGITNPAGETHTFTYTHDGLLTAHADPNGNASLYAYDDMGRLLSAEDTAGGYKTLVREKFSAGYQVTMTTAEGRATAYRVERLPTGHKRMVNTFPGGARNEALMGTDGTEVIHYTDGTTVTVVEGPDSRWGMLAPVQKSLVVETPGGLRSEMQMARTTTLSDSNQLLDLVTQVDTLTFNGKTTTSVFDALTRRITETSPVGRQTFAQVDDQGRVLWAQSAGLPYAARYTYDARGRPATITLGPGDDAALDRTYTFAYNAQGYVAAITDPLGQRVGFHYDDAGRVVTQTFADGREVAFAYDANGNTTAIAPPGRPAHGFAYTPVDLLATYTPPALTGVANPATAYTYTLDRDLALTTRPDGLTIDPTYDPATGRLTQVALPGGRAVAYDYYDGSGGEPNTGQVQRVTVAPENDTLTYTYDGSLLTSERWGGMVQGVISTTYNNDFALDTLTVNDADFFASAWRYDDDGLPIQVTGVMSSAGLSATLALAYDLDHGLLTGTALDAVTSTQGYNGFGELAAVHATAAGAPLFAVTYDTAAQPRDKLGRITILSETVAGDSATYRYAYDDAGRLTDVWQDGALSAHYGYDANGNRITHTLPLGGDSLTPADVVYDDQDRLVQYGDIAYTYTDNGELLTRTENGQTTTYTYDVLGNLRAVTLPDGTQIDYVIDGANRRVGKKVDGALVQGFLYQDWLNPVAELDGSGDVVSVFIYSSRVNVPDVILSRKADGVTWVAYRVLADHLGSPRLVVNAATGDVVQRMDYDAFGNVLQDTNPGFQPFGFAGGIYDQDTKLTRFGARDYDAEVGRWTAKDPIRFGGGDGNLYGYVLGNPMDFLDPIGLEILVCVRKVDNSVIRAITSGSANHAYLWNTKNGDSAGMGGSATDSGVTDHPLESGPWQNECNLVEGSKGHEDQIMDWMRENADTGIWFPWINDCFIKVREAIEQAGLEFPGVPCDRLGGCKKGNFQAGRFNICKETN